MRYYREKKEHLWDFYSNLYNSPLPIGAVQLEEGAIDTVTHRKACRSEVRLVRNSDKSEDNAQAIGAMMRREGRTGTKANDCSIREGKRYGS